MDGQFEKLEELIYVESHLSNTSTKFYGEITQQVGVFVLGKRGGDPMLGSYCGLGNFAGRGGDDTLPRRCGHGEWG